MVGIEPTHHEGTDCGAVGWIRTNNVYHVGPDLQSGDAHALASTTALNDISTF